MSSWQKTLYDLILKASSDIPKDVEKALERGLSNEEPRSNAARALETILENVQRARTVGRPLCQDTGTLLFWVEAPPEFLQSDFRGDLGAAVGLATENGILRRNCVETLTGRNIADNVGRGNPLVHWNSVEAECVRVSLVLKGGGCENVGVQYSLPDSELDSGRDLDGVHRCVLDAVFRAQGRGCSPGVVGVTVGGDRASGYASSKKQFLRKIGQRNQSPDLAAFEERVLAEANQLGIGPMGLGGRTTLLDVFVDSMHRVPASYFVSVSYMCWAFRRHSLLADLNGRILEWK